MTKTQREAQLERLIEKHARRIRYWLRLNKHKLDDEDLVLLENALAGFGTEVLRRFSDRSAS